MIEKINKQEKVISKKNFELIRNLFLKISKKDLKIEDIKKSENTVGWVIGDFFIAKDFLKEKQEIQELLFEMYFVVEKLIKLRLQNTYPDDVTVTELQSLIDNDDFAVSQYSITKRDEKSEKLIGKTFLESEEFKESTEEYINVLDKMINSQLFPKEAVEYFEAVKNAFSAKNLKGYYPEVWEKCDIAYLNNSSKYSFNLHGEEDYLDLFHKNKKIDISSLTENIYKNCISATVFVGVEDIYSQKFKDLDKKIFSYYKDNGLQPRIDSQENVWFGRLLLAYDPIAFMSADTLPNNPKNGKKMRYNLGKIEKIYSEVFEKFNQYVSNDNKIKFEIFKLSRLFETYGHEICHSVGRFKNSILEELKATSLGQQYFLKHPDSFKKVGLTFEDYIKVNLFFIFNQISEISGSSAVDMYGLGGRVVVYKAFKEGAIKLDNNKLIINKEKVKDILLKNSEEIISFLKDENLNQEKITFFLNQYENFFEVAEIKNFIKSIKI